MTQLVAAACVIAYANRSALLVMQMRKIWLPTTLYQLLPLWYLIAGSLMLVLFGNRPLGRLSGLMLCAAAVLIGVLRVHGSSKETARKR